MLHNPAANAITKLTARGMAPTDAIFTAACRPSRIAAPPITGIANRKLNSAAATGSSRSRARDAADDGGHRLRRTDASRPNHSRIALGPRAAPRRPVQETGHDEGDANEYERCRCLLDLVMEQAANDAGGHRRDRKQADHAELSGLATDRTSQ